MPSAADLTAYTPLESLLLFRSLALAGVEPAVFSRVSDLLKKNPGVRDAPTYDPGRLSPDALRELYLRLLKEEVRSEWQQHQERASSDAPPTDDEGRNGDGAPPSRKRKAPSPVLPTVQEAAQHAHLIPQLVLKLYARFRDTIVREIRDDERRYDTLKREIGEVGRGEWDDKIRHEIDRGVWTEVIRRQDVLNGKTLEHHDASRGHDSRTKSARDETHPGLARKDAAQASATPSSKGSPVRPVAQLAPSDESRSLSPAHSRTPARSPVPSRLAPPPSQAGPSAISSGHQSPYAQPPQPQVSSQSASPTPPNAASGRHALAPHGHHHPPSGFTQISGSSTSRLGSPPQRPPLPAPSLSASPQRVPPPPSASPAPSGSSHVPPQIQHSRGFPAHPPHQPPYPPPQPFSPPHQGGYMLPPFQVTPQDPTRAQLQPQQPAPAPSSRAHPSTPTPKPAAARHPGQPPYTHPHIPDILRQLATYTPDRPRPPPLHIPPSSSFKRSSILQPPTDPVLVDRAPSASPISERAPSPEFARPTVAPRTRRKANKARDVSDETALLDATSRTRSGAAVGRRTRQTRGASVASSSAVASSVGARGRTRSQSVFSHAEDAASQDVDDPGSRRVKNEPRTPSVLPDDVSTIEGTPSTVAPRGRRGKKPPLPVATGKRKRPARDESLASSTPPASAGLPPDPTTTTTTTATTATLPHPLHEPKTAGAVLATRHFPRVSAAVMDDILSHRHASLFAAPVKERNAEGYAATVRRPQDLKSIRAAITAGAKAVAAASSSSAADTPSGGPAGSPGSGGGGGGGTTGSTVLLPASPDLVPPRGIVNSAQLARELTRLFANAVMFNVGAEDEGVVRDAREMWAVVERSVHDWRGAAERMGRGLPAGWLAGGAGRRGMVGESGGEEREREKEREKDEKTEAVEEVEEEMGRGKRRRV